MRPGNRKGGHLLNTASADPSSSVRLESDGAKPGRLFLGCPVQASAAWVGSLFSSRDRSRWLREYSQVFNTVEGNSTFYGLPVLDTVRRWAAETADGFRFCLKWPKAVSHDFPLGDQPVVTRQFLDILSVLHEANRLGPSFLQLGPAFSGRQFDRLVAFLKTLPREFPQAVEVRHADWFDRCEKECAIDDALRELHVDRVLFDSRALFSRPPSDEAEVVSQQRKPRSPHRVTVTGRRPFLRFIGRNAVSDIDPWIEEWAPVVAGWLKNGLDSYVFTHTPDDAFAPEFARRFHERLRPLVPGLSALPPGAGKQPSRPRQLNLFGD